MIDGRKLALDQLVISSAGLESGTDPDEVHAQLVAVIAQHEGDSFGLESIADLMTTFVVAHLKLLHRLQEADPTVDIAAVVRELTLDLDLDANSD